MSRIAALTLALALSATAAAAGSARLRFDVPEPFRIGERHYGAGTIAVRSVGVASQARTLVEVWVDGSCLGALAATRDASGPVSLRDEALFQRDGEGGLVMVGFRVAGDRDGAFRFDETEALSAAGATLAEARTPISRR